MKTVNLILMLIIYFSVITIDAKSQCGCPGVAPIDGSSVISNNQMVGGTANIGIIEKSALRIASFYHYGIGDKYFELDVPSTPVGTIRSFSANYLNWLAGYGLTKDLTIEAELGYFILKRQDFTTYDIRTNGLSHLLISGKYNIISNTENGFEWTLGAGGSIPIPQNTEYDSLYQHLQPSSGAYGLVLLSFIRKSLNFWDMNLFLINRFETYSTNHVANKYKYGSSLITSLFASHQIFGNLMGLIEIRNEYRDKDIINNVVESSSGGTQFIFAPQLNYAIDGWQISGVFELPFYKYYYGKQLSNKFSYMFYLSKTINL